MLIEAKLTPSTIELIKSSANLIASHATTITALTHKKLFKKYPMLQELFKDAPQNQHEILAEALSLFAVNIDKMHILYPALQEIAMSHVKVNIRPNYYILLGIIFVESLEEIIGDKVDTNVIDAWREVYKYISSILINMENHLYGSELPELST